MFKNIFKGKKSIKELAQTAEIYPAMDDGNYKAFIIQIIESNTYFSSVLKKEGKSAINVFIEAIESRISNRNFDDPLSIVEKMF